MTTQFEIDLALMAGASYISTRTDINQFPVQDGWVENIDKRQAPLPSGFEATYFTKGTNIVISFAGTYPGSLLGPTNILGIPVDLVADADLGLGIGSDQLLQAVDYYLQVKAANPDPNVNIIFTGHSLGGGIAALMGVFFGKQAITFDQAPFAKTAEPGWLGTPSYAFDIKTYLLAKSYSDPAMAAVRDAAVADLDTYLHNQQINGGIPNSDLISNTRVDGELLTNQFPIDQFSTIGNTAPPILHGTTSVSGTNLHSQTLLTAFLQSDFTATTVGGQKQSLSEVTKQLTDLLGMIFNPNLYSFNTDKNKQSFLEHLVRNQVGGVDGVPIGGDAMVTRFTSDLWKLAQNGGMTMTENTTFNWNNVSKALTAFAMQFYYEGTANAINPNKQLFTNLSTANEGSNGIRFDMHDVSTAAAAAIDANKGIDFTAKDENGHYILKGYQYFQDYLSSTSFLTPAEQQFIKSLLPYMRDWYVQAGASGMNATDTLNRGAFMLGGSGGDALVGGTGADLLVGNGGDDLLQGKAGNDFLLGGAGNDAYVYTSGDGFDTILDSDGNGSIAMDGAILAGGAQYGDNHVYRSADGHTYTFVTGNAVSGGNLIIDGDILIEGYQPGQGNHMGLTMSGAVAAPASEHTIAGDLKVIDYDITAVDIQWHLDSYGNLSTDADKPQNGRSDLLHGSADNDTLIGKGGSDMLYGKEGNDLLYGNTPIGIADAIANGNSQAGSGQLGDWLNGGAGNDTLIGGNGIDVLAGGVGSDLLIGGAGDDLLMGDNESMPADHFDALAATYSPYWSFSSGGDGSFVALYNVPPPDSGWDLARAQTDVIYGGAGNDFALGGRGDDVIFGEGDSDKLVGNSGNDILLGGDGQDYLIGDTTENYNFTVAEGNDYLDGGAGDDALYGNGGDDILIGGTGNDYLNGGAGNDIYIYNAGDGIDHIYDNKGEHNIIRFGAGVDQSNIKLHLGSLMLDLGGGLGIHIDGFDQNDVFNSSSISSFEFADGSVLTLDQLLARGLLPLNAW